jgi:hypothetical protein
MQVRSDIIDLYRYVMLQIWREDDGSFFLNMTGKAGNMTGIEYAVMP